jgi:4-hydroxy-tetrahydrodipicolinate reductase
MAAPHFPYVEVVEQHMERKRDAPSGTAVKMARSRSPAARAPAWAPSPPAGVGPRARGADVHGVCASTPSGMP